MDVDDGGRSGNNGNGRSFTVKDCLGVGDVIGHLKDVLFWFLDSRKRHLDNEARKLRNLRLGLENAAFFADLAKRLGSTDQEVMKLLFYGSASAKRLTTNTQHIEGEEDDKP